MQLTRDGTVRVWSPGKQKCLLPVIRVQDIINCSDMVHIQDLKDFVFPSFDPLTDEMESDDDEDELPLTSLIMQSKRSGYTLTLKIMQVIILISKFGNTIRPSMNFLWIYYFRINFISFLVYLSFIRCYFIEQMAIMIKQSEINPSLQFFSLFGKKASHNKIKDAVKLLL